jgi:hypothetical protein
VAYARHGRQASDRSARGHRRWVEIHAPRLEDQVSRLGVTPNRRRRPRRAGPR